MVEEDTFGLSGVKIFFVLILGIAILAYVIVVVFGTLQGSTIIPVQGLSSSQTVLAASTSSLSPDGDEITSSEVKANNQTWINCTTSDSLVVDINQSKATVSVWFANETLDWTSLIKSDGDIYIDGSLDAGWTWLPYFVSGDTITFCKSDGSTFLNVSVDAIRVYEQALNSTEVTEVYNYGR